MIINMFGGTPFPFSEASAFTGNLGLTQSIPVRGLSPDYPNILCNSDDVCQMVTGEGHANVAASTMALILSNKFDLRHTYFLIAGIAGSILTKGQPARRRGRAISSTTAFHGRSTRARFQEAQAIRPPVWPYGYLLQSFHRYDHTPGTRCPISPPLITARCIS
jgi:hypothetical protein